MGQLHVNDAATAITKRLTLNRKKMGPKMIGKILLTLLAVALAVIMIIPFIWMLSTSLKYEADVFTYPIQWIPKRWKFNNYKLVWAGKYSFTKFYLNSLKVSIITVAGQVFITSLAAYAFAKLKFKGSNALFLLYLSTMMIPVQVTLVPKYVLFYAIDLLNTHTSVILPGMFSAFGVFMLRQFFIGIPMEISESAKIDGANEFTIYARLILPLSRNAISSLIILTFVWCWNDYITPLILLRSPSLYTIPLALDLFLSESGSEYNLVMTAAVSAILPLIIIYFFCQQSFIDSIASSAVKG